MTSLNGITIPDTLQWIDEFSEALVSQSVKRTLAGSIVVFHSALTGGKSITLESRSDTGWIKLSVLQQIQALAEVPGLIMTLILRGVTYQVMFRHQDGALDATPVFPTSTSPLPDDYYLVKMQLMTI